MKKVVFFGVGNMGRPMAANLAKAGFDVYAHDVVPALVEEAVKLGCKTSPKIDESLQGADFVVTALPASKHVLDLFMGSGKLFEKIPKSALIIDCSTIAPYVGVEISQSAAKAGLKFIDAPMSGGTGGATAGTLTFMVGGDKADFDRAQPILSAMGKNIFHAGKHGAGLTAKVCNNMLLAIHMIGTAEALNLGVRAGMDPATLSEIMSKSSGRNWSLEVYNPHPGVMEKVPSSNNYQGGFAVDLMLKDLGLADETADTTHSFTPLGKHAREIFQEQSSLGHGKLDFSSVLNLLKDKSK